MLKFITSNSAKMSFIVVYILLFINIGNKGYFLGNSTFLLGLCILGYIVKTNTSNRKSYRLLIPALVLAIVSFYIPAFSIRYLLITMALLFCFESFFGKLCESAFLVLLLISPLFRYASETFTFPIRIWLSELSGQALTLLRFPVETTGNLILVNGENFLVDAACTGLLMLTHSFLLSVFLLAYYQNLYQKKVRFGWQILIFSLTFLLNIMSNLCRIILLVIFRIIPDNPMHDIVGICGLLVYVWLPMIWFIKQVVLKQTKGDSSSGAEKTMPYSWILNSLFLTVTAYLVIFFNGSDSIYKHTPLKIKDLNNYEVKALDKDIIQLKSNSALIYLKSIPDFYSSEHSPIFCWQGSGYSFNQIKEEILPTYRIYTGILSSQNDKLHTAWWFTNGKVITNSQFEWRWRVVKGENKFKLINVTANSEHELKKAIDEWLKNSTELNKYI